MNAEQDQPGMNRPKDASDLVKALEIQYLPLLTRLAADLMERYPSLNFKVYSSPSGSKTPYEGHSISLECLFSEQPLDQPDNVCLEISLCHLTTRPRIMVDVVWGHPSGCSEASLTDAWTTHKDWPEATPSMLNRLAESFTDLCRSFEEAVRRGRPPCE
jgi:hypothetical protein